MVYFSGVQAYESFSNLGIGLSIISIQIFVIFFLGIVDRFRLIMSSIESVFISPGLGLRGVTQICETGVTPHNPNPVDIKTLRAILATINAAYQPTVTPLVTQLSAVHFDQPAEWRFTLLLVHFDPV